MNKKNKGLGGYIIAMPYFFWAAIFILVPIAIVCVYAFTDKSGSFTFGNFAEAFSSDNMGVFIDSAGMAFISTIICLILAYPTAYFISLAKDKLQKTLVLLMMLPMWTNILIRTYSWLALLEDNGFINNFFKIIGLPTVKMIGTSGAVMLGMVYSFLPFMVLPIYSVMTKMDKRLIEAAEDLGCNKFNVLTKVIFPLSLPGVASGITMVFVPAISTFYISQRLGANKTILIGDKIETQFLKTLNYNLGAALAFFLMILIFICMAVVNRFTDSSEEITP